LPCTGRAAANELPVADTNRRIPFVLPGEKITVDRPIVERWDQTLAFQRRNRLAAQLGRISGPTQFDTRRHDVDQMTHLPAKLAARFDLPRPMHHERAADAPFVAIMLVQPPGRRARVSPRGAVADRAGRTTELI